MTCNATLGGCRQYVTEMINRSDKGHGHLYDGCGKAEHLAIAAHLRALSCSEER